MNTKCSDGGTTINTASHLQLGYPARHRLEDGIHFAALLGSPAELDVRIGNTLVESEWTFVPDGGVGIDQGEP